MLKTSNLQLSKIEELLQQMDAAQGDKPPDNRRRSPRLAIRTTLSAMVLAHGGNRDFKVFTRNISTSGIGFVCRRFCRQGEFLVFIFRLPGRVPKMVLTQVSFSRYVRAGLYEVGVAFIECATGSEERDIPDGWFCRDRAAPIPAPGKKAKAAGDKPESAPADSKAQAPAQASGVAAA